jgi:hypothetical protein
MDWSRVTDADGNPTPGGSGWYRCHLPHRALLDAGVGSVIGRLIGDRRSGRLGVREWGTGGLEADNGADHYDCDIVVMQRWMLAELPDDIRRARATGQLVVNDMDDWFFGLASQNLASKKLNSDERSNLAHYRRILAAGSMVVTSTPYLGERVRPFAPVSKVFRNHIDLRRWPDIAQNDEPVLGWAGAIPWRSGDLETLRGVVGPLCERRGVRFHHSGHVADTAAGEETEWPTAGDVLGVPAGLQSSTPMSTVAEWPQQFTRFDIGIIPLSDRPFNLAKSGIKGLEYVAAGRPFVAQATPEYRHLAELGIGRVARKPRDWIRQLEELVGMTAGERELEAKRNREAMVAAGLTTDQLAEHWLEAVVGGLGD